MKGWSSNHKNRLIFSTSNPSGKVKFALRASPPGCIMQGRRELVKKLASTGKSPIELVFVGGGPKIGHEQRG